VIIRHLGNAVVLLPKDDPWQVIFDALAEFPEDFAISPCATGAPGTGAHRVKILLDTDICIYAINQKRPAVLARIRDYRIGTVGISSITYAELRFGVENSGRVEENLDRLERFLLPLEILPFDAEAGRQYGRLRAELKRAGCPIGSNDLEPGRHAGDQQCPGVYPGQRLARRAMGLIRDLAANQRK